MQGRNQDLNLAKQKYEILTGHKNPCKKLYKIIVYQAKKLYEMTNHQVKTLKMIVYHDFFYIR